MSFDVSRVSVQIGREEISFETGKLARQAGGAVVVRSGDTMVLSTATVGNLRDRMSSRTDIAPKSCRRNPTPESADRQVAARGWPTVAPRVYPYSGGVGNGAPRP